MCECVEERNKLERREKRRQENGVVQGYGVP